MSNFPENAIFPNEHLSDYDQHQADMADDELQRIVNFKRELECTILVEQKRCREINLTEMQVLIQDAFDEAHRDSWYRNLNLSGSIGWPRQIPPFGTLSFKTPKQQADEDWRRMHPKNLSSN